MKSVEIVHEVSDDGCFSDGGLPHRAELIIRSSAFPIFLAVGGKSVDARQDYGRQNSTQ